MVDSSTTRAPFVTNRDLDKDKFRTLLNSKSREYTTTNDYPPSRSIAATAKHPRHILQDKDSAKTNHVGISYLTLAYSSQ